MKIIQTSLLSLATLLAGCATTAKFPISTVAPAAEISAKKTMDENKNYVIELVELNLTSTDRLNTPKNHYNVWIVTEQNDYKNLGQVMNANAKKVVFKTLTPFNPKEIILTAEDEGNRLMPAGIEIARTSFKK
jgi:lipopolysaccharide export LptBFGC system permease protein LptF